MAKYEIPAADYKINGIDYKKASQDELLDEWNRLKRRMKRVYDPEDKTKRKLIKEELDCRNII